MPSSGIRRAAYCPGEVVPGALPGVPGVVHSGRFLDTDLAGARQVAVVGSGQSGAEVFLDLVRADRLAALQGH